MAAESAKHSQRGNAASAERRRVPSAEAAPRRVRQNPYELVGMNPRDVWLLTAALFFGSGFCGAVAWVLSSQFNDLMGVIAVIAMLCAPLMVLGARHHPDAWWGTHARQDIAFLLLFVDGLAMGRVVTSSLTWVLITMVSVAYLQTWRASVPYVTAGLAATAFVILHSGAPFAHLRALFTILVFAQIIFAVVLSQQLLRSVASASIARSLVDPLTGLSNLRFLRSRIEQEIARAPETGDWPVLFNLDLDDFKRVNDEISHSTGDAMLKGVGEAIRARVAPYDVVSRRGGDEFSVLVIAREGRDLGVLAQRLAEGVHIARVRVDPNGGGGGSVGYAAAKPGDDVDALIARADESLHDAKVDASRGGSRRREQAEPPPEAELSDFGRAELAKEDRLNRRAEFALGVRLAWLTLASATALMATGIALAIALGWAPDLRNQAGWAGVAAGYVLAGLFLVGASRRWGWRWVHCGFLLATAALAYCIFNTQESRQALADSFLLIFIGPFLFFRLKQALPYAVGSMALFSVALVTSNYAYSSLRISFTAITVTYVALDLARARRLTREYARDSIELSAVDGLTGAANLRGLRLDLAARITAASRQDAAAFALVSIDLDDFKSVNDKRSHTVGDAMLAATANALSECVRAEDLVARRGGDEFSVVRELDDAVEMDELCARLRSAVRAARLEICPELEPGASIGWTTWRRGDTVGSLMARADRELHTAKTESRYSRRLSVVNG